MVIARDHPLSIPTWSPDYIYCINTTTNTFWGGGKNGRAYLWSDYDESSRPDVVLEAQKTAEFMLNGKVVDVSNTPISYDLGVSKDTFVKLNDGCWKKMSEIQINEQLEVGGRVLGIVDEVVHHSVINKGVCMSASQLLWNEEFKEWRRSFDKRWKPGVNFMRQLFTENGTFIIS